MQELIDLINAYRVAITESAKEQALVALFDHINPKIYTYFLGYVPDQEAQDLRSITLIDIHKGIDDFKGYTSQSAWAWCYTIAWRKLAKYFGEKGSAIIESREPENLEELVAASVEIKPFESEIEKMDVKDALAILKKSDPNCFQVLWDHFIADLAYGELAEKMGKSADAVRMQISRCLEKIEPLLS